MSSVSPLSDRTEPPPTISYGLVYMDNELAEQLQVEAVWHTKKARPTRTQLSDFAIQTVENPWCSGLPLRLGEIRFILQLLHIRVKFSLRGGGMQAVLPQHFIEVGAVSAGKLGGT